ncbi:unnamed protein product [Clonostachys rhizophaga]|uniref:Heterokaryon incompatibility domain-containing protein n=1 Tax=Clonostachys rhizophaga TaxID=160324 RepID=A0A9N9VM33_9HYPO|nr:unnamed protein product [Clonostachys rhizophaga]
MPRTEPEFWPTRAIFVGDHGQLILVKKPSGDRDYLVLSHCWGKPTKEGWERLCTTPQNYRCRLNAFCLDNLPKTFRDAIEVTRELGKQHLWIGALCIVQGPHGDWESESGRMQHVFSNAYCTIAADSAAGWKDGFLKPSLWDQIVLGSADCDCDFKSGVGEGYLMKRAWVIQEREYSKCGLTYKSDRDTALQSLLERMSRELATDVKYGIARCFIGSLLLWKRTAKEMTSPIGYERRTVPSWSWMAYDGSIEFIDKFRYELRIPQSSDLEFAQDGEDLVKIRKFENCRLGENKRDNEYIVRALRGAIEEVGSIWYDMKDQIEFNYCVVVEVNGTENRDNNPKDYLV